MKKTHVAILATVSVLGMTFVGAWFFIAKGHRGVHPLKETSPLHSPMPQRLRENSHEMNRPNLPSARHPSGGSQVQRAFQTIDDVNRINEMNQRE